MTDVESYVPVEEVAEQLSVKVSTVRQWVNKGFIPKSTYIKVGYTYRFNIPAVIEALKQEEPSDTQEEKGQITQQLELDFNEDDDL
jgi:excisionase family DNA binding protein|tara:strand:- start:770 stop:1027 length:258 start_codon:yes stop_codon:yes gene_type:complete